MNEPLIVTKWKTFAPQILAILRIVAAFMFTMGGAMKLFAIPAGMPPDGSMAHFLSQIWFAGILEFFGGILMLIGLCARPTAFILSGLMAVAYFQVHAPRGVWPSINGGGLAVLYCFLWLYFSSAGAGAWSIDAMRKK